VTSGIGRLVMFNAPEFQRFLDMIALEPLDAR
jgi:hypothetical protein